MKTFFVMLFLLTGIPGLVYCADYSATGSFNFGTSSEGSHSPQMLLGGSVVLGADHVYKELGVELRAGYARYKADYFVIPYGTSITVNGLSLNENRYDYAAIASYPVYKKAEESGKEKDQKVTNPPASIRLLAGYHGIMLNNKALDYTLGGPIVGLNGNTPVSKYSLDAELSVTPILLLTTTTKLSRVHGISDSSSPTLAGDPYMLMNLSATFWFPGFYSEHIGIGYDGEAMLLQRKERFANSLALRVKF